MKDYEIQRSDLIKGCRWLVFKRINKMVKMHVYGAMTKKECAEWVQKQIRQKRKRKKYGKK